MTICSFVRDGFNQRLGEARELFARIKLEEPQEGLPSPPTALSLTLRGMVYVSLYGTLEYTITQGVQCFINHLSGLSVSTKHLELSLNSIAMNSQLTSVRDSGEKKKWEARRALFSAMESQDACVISDTVFGTFLHNVYPKTVLEIFLCLGIEKPATANESEVGYFKEITEKRNAVAHGRESASEAGSGLTIQDVELRMNVVYSVCSYFLDVIEEHALELKFVKPRYRSNYRN